MTAKTTDSIVGILALGANSSAIMLSINGAVGFLVPLIVCFLSMITLEIHGTSGVCGVDIQR